MESAANSKTAIRPFFQIMPGIELMSDGDPEMRRLLWFLLGGKRGGENRARIIQILRARPKNINQLANELDLQYKAVQHHVRVLVSSSLLVSSGERYGTVFMLSPWFERHMEVFDEVCEKIGFDKNLVGLQ